MDVDVGIAVAVSVGGMGVCVAVGEGVTGVKVSGSAVDTDELKQPTRDSDSSNHIKMSLEKICPLRFVIFIMVTRKDLFNVPGMGDLLRKRL